MITQVKQKLAGLNAAIDLSNRQGCSVKLKQRNQRDIFRDRIEYYFASSKKVTELRYNINPSSQESIADLEHFDLAMPRFILSDMFKLLLEHIELRELSNLTELVVVLDEREFMDDAEDNEWDTEKEHWMIEYLAKTFAKLYEKGFELKPVRAYDLGEGKIYVHFNLLEEKTGKPVSVCEV